MLVQIRKQFAIRSRSNYLCSEHARDQSEIHNQWGETSFPQKYLRELSAMRSYQAARSGRTVMSRVWQLTHALASAAFWLV